MKKQFAYFFIIFNAGYALYVTFLLLDKNQFDNDYRGAVLSTFIGSLSVCFFMYYIEKKKKGNKNPSV